MRPYLAVFKDSFREAFASRILWLITGLITLVLFVGLAPFALREETAYRFQRNEFRNGPEFLQLLASQETAKTPSAARRVWSVIRLDLREAWRRENQCDCDLRHAHRVDSSLLPRPGPLLL